MRHRDRNTCHCINKAAHPHRGCNKAELIGVNLVSEKAEEHLGVDSIFVASCAPLLTDTAPSASIEASVDLPKALR